MIKHDGYYRGSFRATLRIMGFHKDLVGGRGFGA